MVFRRVFFGASTGAGMSGKLLAFLIALFLVFVAGLGVAFGVVPLSIFVDQIKNFQVGLLASCSGGIVFLFWLLLMLYRVPAEIDNEQRELINSHMPNQLNVFVGQAFLPGSRWRIDGEKLVHKTCLTVISQEKKKILEFHATRLELLQRTEDMKPEIRGYIFGSVENNFRFCWKNGEVFTEIIPGDRDELLLAELDPVDGYPVFGKSKTSSIHGKKPSIYELYIQFKGRRNGEDDFAYFNYRTEIYCHPENNILDFADDSPDILDNLKSKIFFANISHEEL